MFLLSKILDNPLFFDFFRKIINFGMLKKIIAGSLDYQRGEKVIDVGCGTGGYSTLVKDGYVGVDINNNFIEYAKKKYRIPGKKFKRLDIKNSYFGKKEFDKALYISMLHHFDNSDNIDILRNISNITKKKIIIVDVLPSNNIFRKLLLRLDQGKYIRTIDQQLELILKVLNIERKVKFYTKSRSAKHSMFICRPTTVQISKN